MTIEAAYRVIRRAEHHECRVWGKVDALWHIGQAVGALARMRWVARGVRLW